MGANTPTDIPDTCLEVSIHAPVMGAKEALAAILADTQVSIHAPVMGANYVYNFMGGSYGFNPRARDGRE